MTLHLLGTGAPFAHVDRAPTMLAFEEAGRVALIDCGGDAARALHVAGIAPDQVDVLILTHEHPDHTAGLPLLLLKFRLAGRTAPLVIAGNPDALAQGQRLVEAYAPATWQHLFPLTWRAVPHEAGVLLHEDETFRIVGAPGVHSAPTLGVRVEGKASGRVCAYSCDTEPAASIADLARGAHVLVHEATGAGAGHSSAAQAAEVAVQTGADRLVLVHLRAPLDDADLAAARTRFPHLIVGEDHGTLSI